MYALKDRGAVRHRDERNSGVDGFCKQLALQRNIEGGRALVQERERRLVQQQPNLQRDGAVSVEQSLPQQRAT